MHISFQCLPISNSSQSGPTGFILSQNSISCFVPLEISEEIIGLESTTNNSIYINPLFLSSPSLSSLILLPSSSANFSASSFDNLPSFNFLRRRIDSFIIFSASSILFPFNNFKAVSILSSIRGSLVFSPNFP